ncbi:MAG: hypothetical protein COB17_08700 [Sulfurimonas sp.]|nr:MAG: hypothetical protein COB17_08700 [Sulfurimonas sp.]
MLYTKGQTIINLKDLKEFSSKLNVLYVEDEEILREGLKSTLSKLFKNTFIAQNGKEALDLYINYDIDIIMTDINMPIMDGTKLIQNIQKLSDEEPLIIVLSAHHESKLLTMLINMGVNYFLNKPLDKQLLINSLYKTCKIISEKKLIIEYEIKLHDELERMDRTNKILTQKLNQLANQTNKNIPISSINKNLNKENLDKDYYLTLLRDHKDEIEELSDEIDEYIDAMFKADNIDTNYLSKLANAYSKYASLLISYPEFNDLSSELLSFSKTILTLEEKFMKDIYQTAIYFESLQLTLKTYKQNIWNKHANNPKFYNASLINDIKLVIDFLEDKEAEENYIEFF